MILKLLLCFIFLILIPMLWGTIATKFMKEKNNILLIFVLGYLFQFAVFEIMYLPMYFANCTFRAVMYVWYALNIIVSIISIIVNRKRLKEIWVSTLDTLRNLPKMIIIFFILLALQIYVPVMYMQHIDLDDARYLSLVTTNIETNTLFQYESYTGELPDPTTSQLRNSLAGLFTYYGSLSEMLKIPPTILEHTIWPAIAILLEFSVYALIGNEILKKDKEKLTYFLIFLSIIYIFGFISIYTNFAFFAYRSWQGKAMLGNFMIPAVWLIYRYCIKNEKSIIYWLTFLAMMFASCFVTEMGVFAIPIEVGVLSIISLIQNRKIGPFIKSMMCCIPQLIIGFIYIIAKGG